MKNFFEGSEKTWKKFIRPGLKIASQFCSPVVAAKIKILKQLNFFQKHQGVDLELKL